LAVTLVIGNSVKIPDNIFAPAYTMASVIANQFNEATGLQRSALIEVALILFLITFIINVIARLLVWKVTHGQRAVIQECLPWPVRPSSTARNRSIAAAKS